MKAGDVVRHKASGEKLVLTGQTKSIGGSPMWTCTNGKGLSNKVILEIELEPFDSLEMTEDKGMECMVFERKGEQYDHEGLGVHPFRRIPVPGEYIFLENEKVYFYRVTHVVHTPGPGNHDAELYVLKDTRTKAKHGNSAPPID